MLDAAAEADVLAAEALADAAEADPDALPAAVEPDDEPLHAVNAMANSAAQTTTATFPLSFIQSPFLG